METAVRALEHAGPEAELGSEGTFLIRPVDGKPSTVPIWTKFSHGPRSPLDTISDTSLRNSVPRQIHRGLELSQHAPAGTFSLREQLCYKLSFRLVALFGVSSRD